MRHLGATLNWHCDPDYEMRMTAKLIEIECRLDALLLNADSCSSTPPETDCT